MPRIPGDMLKRLKEIPIVDLIQSSGVALKPQGNEQKYLPAIYEDMVEAWERLDHWQKYVKLIKSDYMHRVKED